MFQTVGWKKEAIWRRRFGTLVKPFVTALNIDSPQWVKPTIW